MREIIGVIGGPSISVVKVERQPKEEAVIDELQRRVSERIWDDAGQEQRREKADGIGAPRVDVGWTRQIGDAGFDAGIVFIHFRMSRRNAGRRAARLNVGTMIGATTNAAQQRIRVLSIIGIIGALKKMEGEEC